MEGRCHTKTRRLRKLLLGRYKMLVSQVRAIEDEGMFQDKFQTLEPIVIFCVRAHRRRSGLSNEYLSTFALWLLERETDARGPDRAAISDVTLA